MGNYTNAVNAVMGCLCIVCGACLDELSSEGVEELAKVLFILLDEKFEELAATAVDDLVLWKTDLFNKCLAFIKAPHITGDVGVAA